jgi:ParB-like chromosome segregation protein Spo0J
VIAVPKLSRKMAQKIELWPISKLEPYANNANQHPQDQIDKIAESIRSFGFNNPVLVQSDGTIIAGHGRLEALRQLEWKEVPVVVLDHLQAHEARAYLIADNELARLAYWDEELLGDELRALDADGVDLGLLGFGDDRLADLLGLSEEGELPELDGAKSPFEQMTFVLHETQAADVRQALDIAKGFEDLEGSPNENSNGNALHAIVRLYLQERGPDARA